MPDDQSLVKIKPVNLIWKNHHMKRKDVAKSMVSPIKFLTL